MKKTKKNQKILTVVEVAKVYVKAGYKLGQAIDMAQREVREVEIEIYEK